MCGFSFTMTEKWGMPQELTSTCASVCILEMFCAAWSDSKNGSMMFGHMMSHWPIIWKQEVCQGEGTRCQNDKNCVHHSSENGDKNASMFSSTGEFTSPRSHWSTWMVLIRWKMEMDKRETLTWRSMVSSHIWSSTQRCYNILINALTPRNVIG